MRINKLLGSLLIALSIVYVGFQFLQLEYNAAAIRALTMVLLTALYIKKVKNKNIFFSMFLFLFAIGDIFNLITWSYSIFYNPLFELHFYFIGNIIYISAYIFLIIRMISSLNFPKAIKKFPIQTLLLVILGVFCVNYVTETTLHKLTATEYLLELIYNATVVTLMCLALINYMYHDDKKSINLLIGSIFIVFSEVIQLAYFYVAGFRVLNVICSVCLVLAFTFFYWQALLNHCPSKIYKYDQIKA